MIKVWLLILMMSAPNMPSVKHNAFLYPNEDDCMKALTTYLNMYERKSPEYKENLKTTGYCLPFDAFPIQGLNTL